MAVGGFRVRLVGVGEQPGGFDDDVHAEFFPRQFRRRLGADDENFLAVNNQHVVLGLVGGGFFRANRAGEAALRGIVFEQVGEIVGGHDVADGDDFDFLAEQALFSDRAKDEATDPTESVDGDFDWHNLIF